MRRSPSLATVFSAAGLSLLSRETSAISPYPNLVGSQQLQCDVYALAVEYGVKIQPSMTPTQKQALVDALTRSVCNSSTTAADALARAEAKATAPAAADGVVTTPSVAETDSAAPELFVDPVNGKDTNAGTITAPLKTIAAAQTLTRKTTQGGNPAIITLRSGTHYLGNTLALTAEDSHLTIRSYSGDQDAVVVSGATPVDAAALKWEAYAVSSNSSTTMSSLPNLNCVWGATFKGNNTNIDYVGTTPDAQTCSDKCLHDPGCDAFTWHDPDQPSGEQQWDNQCYFVNRGGSAPACHAQTHHFSGKKSTTVPLNVWVARGAVKSAKYPVDGLRVNGERAIRARYPNGNPEYQLFPDGWLTDVKWAAPAPRIHDPADVTVLTPNRSDEGPCSSNSGYCYYVTGINGACEQYGYEPPSGYWCNSDPPRGQGYTVQFPSALTSTTLGSRPWKHWKPNETVVNAFRSGHWFSYVFLVDNYALASDNSSAQLGWTVGGFQGGEGAGGAAEYNVENVLDELDSYKEWYLDSSTGDLYFYPNNTDPGQPPSSKDLFEVTQLEQLVTITGAGSARGETGAHAVDISISGVTFTAASLTTLSPHGLPSDGGGDWAVARRGAVHLSGVEGVTIEDCLFERIDGNGVMISGYSRNTSIVNNEFHLVGENGIVSWGYTADYPNVTRPTPIPTTQGPDARDGNHPQGNNIAGNFFHEIGHFQKQVSCYFQAQTQLSTLRNNICFNGPRAGINFNDGLGGGNVLDSNLIFNMVRETQDHGTFNSWDRQPFYYASPESPDGTFVPRYNQIYSNFWMNDYNSQEAVDNDDDSCYYETYNNFFPFSNSGLKNDFGGHDNHHHNNMYINSGRCMAVNGQKKDHEDMFYNNTCIIYANSPQYASYDTKSVYGGDRPTMHDNRVYTKDGKATESGGTIAQCQAQGYDLRTTVAVVPSDADIVKMARELLSL